MYAEAYGLREEPFSPTPDPAYLVLTPDHREALAGLEYGLRERRGFISLVGEVGTGKTTLLYALLRRLQGEIDTAFFSHTTLGFDDLLWAMLRDLGVTPPSGAKRDLIAALDAHLHRQADAGRITALIIDEAQNLSCETLEELRLLSNFETFRHKLLQIVLVGQPELDATLAQPRVRQLRDRIAVRARLRPLPAAMVPDYVRHRLGVAGFDGAALFSDAALRDIARLSAGVPRRINALCHGALLCAYARREPQVSRAAVLQAAGELGLDGRPPSPAPAPPMFGAARRRRLAVGTALATMLLVGPGAHQGLDRQVDVRRVSLAASGCAPTAPRMTDPPRRQGETLVQVPQRGLGDWVASAGASLAGIVDFLVPSSGYQEWHRMHQPRRATAGERREG
jgi:general secretion pathway protein A